MAEPYPNIREGGEGPPSGAEGLILPEVPSPFLYNRALILCADSGRACFGSLPFSPIP